MDDLFGQAHFDERDLIRIDKEIQQKVADDVKAAKKVELESKMNNQENDWQQPEQATLKKLEKLDDLKFSQTPENTSWLPKEQSQNYRYGMTSKRGDTGTLLDSKF